MVYNGRKGQCTNAVVSRLSSQLHIADRLTTEQATTAAKLFLSLRVDCRRQSSRRT